MKYSIFYVDGGLGRNIMATAVVRNIKKAYPDRELIVLASFPGVFLNNPYIYRTYLNNTCPYFYNDFIDKKDFLLFKQEPYYHTDVAHKKKHIVEAWCDLFRIECDNIYPEYHETQIENRDSEILAFKFNKPIVAVQCNGGAEASKNHFNFHWYRDIPPYYFQTIIDKYKDYIDFVQIRQGNQIVLDNTHQIDLPPRELISFLKHCSFGLCIDSAAQHILAAHKIPSLVCWIGNSPKVFGYDMHKNIMSNLIIDQQLIEGYIEPFPINAESYQSPTNYDFATLFDLSQLDKVVKEFIKDTTNKTSI